MREFVISKAPQDRVAALTRAIVEDVGGVVSQHTERVTEFDNLVPEEGDWSRSGFVGTYKNHGEDPVRVRIRVWARWPRILVFWGIFLGFIQALLLFSLALAGLSPPANVWILMAVVTFAFVGIALVMYASSWADSADIEDALARRLKRRFIDDEHIEGDVYTLGEWEEYTEEMIETARERAREEAPDRPSRARKTISNIAPSGLLQGSEEDDEESEDEKEAEETQQTTSSEEPKEPGDDEEDEEGASFVDRLMFWKGSNDDADQDETAEAS